jgi:hypothetical protein
LGVKLKSRKSFCWTRPLLLLHAATFYLLLSSDNRGKLTLGEQATHVGTMGKIPKSIKNILKDYKYPIPRLIQGLHTNLTFFEA